MPLQNTAHIIRIPRLDLVKHGFDIQLLKDRLLDGPMVKPVVEPEEVPSILVGMEQISETQSRHP